MRLSGEVIEACLKVSNPDPILREKFPAHPDIPLMSQLIKFAQKVKEECDCIVTYFSLEKGYVKSVFTGPDGISYEIRLDLPIPKQ